MQKSIKQKIKWHLRKFLAEMNNTLFVLITGKRDTEKTNFIKNRIASKLSAGKKNENSKRE